MISQLSPAKEQPDEEFQPEVYYELPARLSPGEYELLIIKEGYLPHIEEFTVTGFLTKSIYVEMDRRVKAAVNDFSGGGDFPEEPSAGVFGWHTFAVQPPGLSFVTEGGETCLEYDPAPLTAGTGPISNFLYVGVFI